jgi:ribose transport system substrate-binding protein
MKRRILAIAGVLAMVLTGCSAGSSDSDDGGGGGGGGGLPEAMSPADARKEVYDIMKGKRIAFIPILYKGYELTQNWGGTMERSFTRMGAKFDVYDSNFDTNQMVQTIDNLIARKSVDVLVLHNPDVGVLTKQIEDAAKAGIYTVVINMISNRSGDLFVGADVIGSAEDVTKRAVEDCNKRGAPKNLAVIDGPGNDAFSLQWNQGVEKVAKEEGFKIVRTAHSEWQNSAANQAATQIIQQQGQDLCAFMVTFDENAVAVGNAVADAEGRGLVPDGAVGVYTMAAGSRWCEAARAGNVTASAAYDIPGIGSAIVAGTQQLLERGEKPGSTHTVSILPHVIVDQSNMDDYTVACYTAN